MTPADDPREAAAKLRALAEAAWQTKAGAGLASLSPEQMRAVLHELEVLQIELEMQNDELLRSEETARQLLSEINQVYAYSPIGLFVCDRDYRFLRINEHMAEINGCSVAHHAGKTLDEIAPDLAEFLKEAYRPIFERGEPVLNVEIHGQTPKESDHERSWIGNYFPLKSGTGEVIGLIGAVLEITARIRTEAALRESADWLAEAQSVAKMGSWATNISTMEVHWSEELYHVLEIDPRSFAASHLAFLELVHPEDRAAVDAAFVESFDRGSVNAIGHRIITPNGLVKSVEERWRIQHDEQGRPVRAVGTCQDITERKNAEAAAEAASRYLESLIASIDGIVWEADATTFQFIFVSLQSERLLGYPTQAWLDSPTFWKDHIHPDDRDQALGDWIDCTSKLGDHVFDYRMIAADGREIWIHDVVTVMVEDGRPVTLRGIMVDVTARKQAEAQRRALEAQLSQAQKLDAIGTLAGGIAHDFNNILAVMLGNLNLAQLEVGRSHPACKRLSEVQSAIDRGTGLVRKILAFSRPSDGAVRTISLVPVIRETLEMVRAMIPSGVEFAETFGNDVPHVESDSTTIHQVLVNLYINAWHAMSDGRGRITLTLDAITVDRNGPRKLDSAVSEILM